MKCDIEVHHEPKEVIIETNATNKARQSMDKTHIYKTFSMERTIQLYIYPVLLDYIMQL
jgi:hypothetical protein